MIHLIRQFSLAAVVLLLGLPLKADAQSAPRVARAPAGPTPDSASDTQVTDSLKRLPRRPVPPPRKLFWLENTVANVYDSNIEHDSTNIGSYGVVAGARTGFRSRSTKPVVQLEYAAALHQYTATDKWDRLSQLGRVAVDMPLSRLLSLGLTGEAYLKGSSEDREIGDQYAIIPRMELRPTRNSRVRLITAYRKRYFEASTSNSTNRYAALDSRVRFGLSTIEGAARFEDNRPELSRLRFQRQTYTMRFIRAATDRDELLFGLEYRPVKYPERTVDIVDENGDEIEVPRKDERWKPQMIWTREWTRNLRTELEYEYEMRYSNDPEKKYRGHVLTFTTAVPW